MLVSGSVCYRGLVFPYSLLRTLGNQHPEPSAARVLLPRKSISSATVGNVSHMVGPGEESSQGLQLWLELANCGQYTQENVVLQAFYFQADLLPSTDPKSQILNPKP